MNGFLLGSAFYAFLLVFVRSAFVTKRLKNRFRYGQVRSSVTRLGNLLDFGQVFKAFGSMKCAQISHFLGNFCEGVTIYHFSSEIIFGQFL